MIDSLGLLHDQIYQPVRSVALQLLVCEPQFVRQKEHGVEESGGLPELLRSHMLLLSHVAADGVLNGAAQHGLDGLLEVLAVQHLAALLVDDLPLGVHHVIVLEHVFPGLEIAGLHLLLCVFNGVGQHFGVDGGVLVYPQLLHHAHDSLRAEQAHDVILQ